MTAPTAGPALRRSIALAYGALCHGSFLAGVGLMALGLSTGMQAGFGRLGGVAALAADAALVLQFPLLHSALLTARGRRVLTRLAPRGCGGILAPTTYALLAGVQIGLTFALWSPSGIVLWRPEGLARVLNLAAFGAAWAFLGKALLDAGLGLQTGWIGWSALLRGRRPAYPSMPERGLFARCRQPIYLGFALVLWTGPVVSVDRIALALVWGAYCVLGPIHKERRFAARYGGDFGAYRRRVPYIIPSLFT